MFQKVVKMPHRHYSKNKINLKSLQLNPTHQLGKDMENMSAFSYNSKLPCARFLTPSELYE